MKAKSNIKYIISGAAVILFAGIVCWFMKAVSNAQAAAASQRLEAVKSSVMNSITLCYSIEGSYPEDLEYLIENYAISYDESKYVIHYDCFAANIRPTVVVVERVR